MAKVFAKNGYQIELLAETPGKSSYDAKINGQAADLKSSSSANNISRYAKKAIGKQGASVVLFEFEKMTPRVYIELGKLKQKGIKFYFYEKGENRVRTL